MYDCGFTKEEIVKITGNLPSFLLLSDSNVLAKINFFRSIGLANVIVNDSKKLMQSLELTYARYAYFQEINHEVNSSNYFRLFYSQKNFIKRYGVDNKTLLAKYLLDDEIKKGMKQNV